MSETVTSALIAAAASVTGSILAFIVALRSLRRSVSSSEGVPIGRFVEAQIGGLDRRLDRVEESLSELREFLAYHHGRSGASIWTPPALRRTRG